MMQKIYNQELWFKKWPNYIPKHLNYPDGGLYDLFQDIALKSGDTTFVTLGNKSYTYSTILSATKKIAHFLQKECGIKHNDVVAIYIPNIPEFCMMYYGALRCGVTVSPVNALYSPNEIKYQCNYSKAKVLVFYDPFWENVKKIKHELNTVEKIICLGRDLQLKEPELICLEDILSNYSEDSVQVKVDPQVDVAIHMFTGGTTGSPKAAALTHKNMVSNCFQFKSLLLGTQTPEPGKEVFIGLLPFTHSYALTTCLHSAVLVSGHIVLFPKFAAIDEVLDAIQKHKITCFSGISTLYNLINSHPNVKKWDLSSLRAAISGAGPLPIEIQKRFEGLTGARLSEGYGLSEASPVTHANPFFSDDRKMGTIGLPLPDTIFKIADIETGEEMKIGVEGELWIAGPQVMKGYHDRLEESSAVLIKDQDLPVWTNQIWLRTGDMAVCDDDGFVKILDRIKFLIKYKGHSVYPREIEDLYYNWEIDNMPVIKECAVVGMPDETGQEEIMAFLVLNDDFKNKISIDDALKWSKANMAGFKYPRLYKFIDVIPKGTANKILRRELRNKEMKERNLLK